MLMFDDLPATGHIDHFYDNSDRDMEMRLYADGDRACNKYCQRFRPRARRQIKHEIHASGYNERELYRSTQLHTANTRFLGNTPALRSPY
jgi:hypothetical protein